MILGVFSVFDNAAKAYLPPMFFRAKGEAVRAFMDAVATTDHQFSKHASDYTLFELGEWDDSNAEFNAFVVPTRVMSAYEAIPK